MTRARRRRGHFPVHSSKPPGNSVTALRAAATRRPSRAPRPASGAPRNTCFASLGFARLFCPPTLRETRRSRAVDRAAVQPSVLPLSAASPQLSKPTAAPAPEAAPDRVPLRRADLLLILAFWTFIALL